MYNFKKNVQFKKNQYVLSQSHRENGTKFPHVQAS